MKLLDKKYYNLAPNFEHLSDSFILGLAWKKTDIFVRTHNWYADILALDKCAFNISNEVTKWSKDITRLHLLKSDIELIPAPKGANWYFNAGKWAANKNDRKLRPLANISIKDQSIATAVMMCFADAIETRQKDCSLSNLGYAEHVKNKVVSYGNRLICDWDNEKARFRCGGSEYYRKFSVDYRTFLQRPIYIGRETINKISKIDDVYIVSLDLKNFFGSIKINLLLEKIKKISSDHYESDVIENNNMFWDSASEVLNWTWSKDSLSLLSQLALEETNVGIPQGLAAAGALANAYLIDFDESLISNLHTYIDGSDVMLHDYCRYVDDIRLVISGEALTNEEIKEIIHGLVQRVLDETLDQNKHDREPYLKINDEKTYIFGLSDIDNGSGLTNRINEIQHEVGGSSIPERNGLDNNIPALQQLLLTEQDDFLDDAGDLFPGFSNDKSIKVESLRRFSAHRLETSLAKKSKLISPEERKQFDNESVLIAKKLLKVWLKDPSIMIIFRKAIAINPNLDAYSKIFDIIFSRIKSNRDKRDKYIMLYLLSDIFRSVVDIYRNLHPEYVADYKKLMSEVTSFAQKLLSCKSSIPSYAYQQALLYLAVINKPFISSNKSFPDLVKLQYVLIKKHLESLNSSDGYLFELSAQISQDYQANAAFLLSHKKDHNKDVDLIIRKFAFRGGEFWNAIWKEIVRDQDRDRIQKFRWAIPKFESKPSGSEHYLSSVISFKENPFKYEHALLKLGVALVDLFDDTEKNKWPSRGKQYSPHEIKIKLDGSSTLWTELWHPKVSISCSIDRAGNVKDPRYKSPGWLACPQGGKKDEQKIYWVCSVLRSAALGNVDYTQRNDLKLDRAKYDGIHTQFYKRRMGMLHTPESIVGSYGTITDWFASFLQHGLQWPGFSSSYIDQEDILSITSLSDFKKCLLERLSYLNAQICTSSNIPALPTVVNRPELASDYFRIVTVQQLFPKETTFYPSDVTLNNPDVRWKHREHLAEICRLTEQTLNAKLKTESRGHTSTADLIVFSELAVHPEDEDIIRALAFRTKAIIFSGFVFCEQDGRIVNKARWIIPDYSESGIQWRVRDQGKYHMTSDELTLGVQGYRPSQHIISIEGHPEGPFKLTGAICYDATDIKLAADLRDLTDMFVIAAYNKDVDTFDNMASALQWHMYQHVVITNTGVYGGSTMQAPYKEKYHKLISHAHGTGQIAISTADIDLAAFRRKQKVYRKTKAQPAGFNRKH